jgi:hypothetical protein
MMAGTNSQDERSPEETARSEANWARKRRSDLIDSFSIIVSVPAANTDDQGNWKYGIANSYTNAPQDKLEEFKAEMAAIVQNSMGPLADSGLIERERAYEADIYGYSTPPAAQEWPRYLINLYLDARPFINDGASLIAWGAALSGLGKRFARWEADKTAIPHERTIAEIDQYTEEPLPVPQEVAVELRAVYSRDSLIAACYFHANSFYEPITPVKVNVYCRGSDYSKPEHPGGAEKYLIVFTTGTRRISYLVTGRGEVFEHFVETDGSVTLMPIPNLFQDQAADWSRVFPAYSTVIE